MSKEKFPATPAIRMMKEQGMDFSLRPYKYEDKGGTQVAARELGPYGVNVNGIAPGVIESTIYLARRTPEEVETWLENSRKSTIMGRIGTTDDTAKLALYLTSDDSSFICGETIVIDGGRFDRM